MTDNTRRETADPSGQPTVCSESAEPTLLDDFEEWVEQRNSSVILSDEESRLAVLPSEYFDDTPDVDLALAAVGETSHPNMTRRI